MKSRRKRRPGRAKSKTAARRRTTPASKAAAPDPLDDVIAATARSLGLTIERAWLPAVRANLKLTLMLGLQAGEFALPDEAEPAPVFRA